MVAMARKSLTFSFLQIGLNVDVNLADHDGVTSLLFAATRSAFRVARLLSAGAEICAVDQNKRSILRYAARAGNSKALGLALEVLGKRSLQDLVDLMNRNGRTPLHDAVRSGLLESVQLLLDSHVNPYVRDIKGKTCLHSASEIGEEKTVRALQHSSLRCFPPVRRGGVPNLEMPKFYCHPGGLHSMDSSRPIPQEVWGVDDGNPDAGDMQSISCVADIVKALLNAKVHSSIIDNGGLSAYEAAVENECNEIACALGSDSRHDAARERSTKGHKAAFKRQRWSLEQARCNQMAGTAPDDTTRLRRRSLRSSPATSP